MAWQIVPAQGAAIVTMNTNRVNAQNDAFVRDLHEAFDRLDREDAGRAVILTATGSTFSAGLDFDEAFPRFARGDRSEIDAWYGRFRAAHLRLFTCPRPTVAAMNGHAIAGGLVTALACDFRLAVPGAELSLNETRIGLPMPAALVELIRHAVGIRAATELILGGRVYAADDALRLGVAHAVVPNDKLVQAALETVRDIPRDAFAAYAFSKRALQAPVLRSIAENADRLDAAALARVMSDTQSLGALARRYEAVKGRRPAGAAGPASA